MTKIKLVFLGSGSSIPTPERGHPSIFIDYNGETMLWDCGEGTQVRMMEASLHFMKISRIFITHWHADHFAGLIGLIETLNLENRKKPLAVYGPEASRFIDAFSELSYWDFGFELEAVDVNFEGKDISKIFENEDYKILSVPVKHSVPAVAYCLEEKDRWNIDMKKARKLGLEEGPVLEELKKKGKIRHGGKTVGIRDLAVRTPGKKIVYSGDTAPCKGLESLARNADLLIHDGTFMEDEISEKKEYLKRRHTSVTEAARIAKEAGVKRLVITHFSRRYRNIKALQKEARKFFPKTEASHDLKEIELG